MHLKELTESNPALESHWTKLYLKVMSQSPEILCNRELLRFIHRRNECDCLREHYYHLKKTTKRTAPCYCCEEQIDIRDALVCKCEVTMYCSRKCQKAHLPKHKRCAQRLSIHLHLRLPGFTRKPIYDGTLGVNFATDHEAFQYLLSMSLHQAPHHPLEFLYFMFHL